MLFKLERNNRLKGVQILALGFLCIIVLGGLILSLPISSAKGESTNLIDSIFTATSAVCVTGLVTVDTGTHWSMFGQTIIMILIEIGGLGFVTFATMGSIALGRKITLRNRLIIQDAMNTFNIQGVVKMMQFIVLFTFSVQIIGAIIFSTQFIPQFGLGKGIYYSIFHSISAFCNAGFDVFGGYASLTGYTSNFIVIMNASLLIIIGGLGFTVWLDLRQYKINKRISTHTKLVLSVTAILIVGSFILMFIFEYNNIKTMANMSFGDKLLNSFFAAVTPRTAGFNSISVADMTIGSLFLTIILMFIGGSPGSTAGGLKTSTIGIIIVTVISVIKGREDAEVFKKRIPKEQVYKAFTLILLAATLVVSVTMILSYTEVGASFIEILFETVSALGTAGLSMGITGDLSNIGKVLIMIMMYLGRVGALTVILSLMKKKSNVGIKYPEGRILIG